MTILVLLTLVSAASAQDYFSILDYTLPEEGVLDLVHINKVYHDKIKPLFASRKLMSDKETLQQFTLLLEAKKCFSEMRCVKKLKPGVPVTTDPFPVKDKDDNSWDGIDRLSPFAFRTQVLAGSSDEWLILFTKITDFKQIDVIRNALLDAYHILKPDKLKLGVVECVSGEYDFCTAMGATPALVLWNKNRYFKGTIALYDIAKFIVTHVHDVNLTNYKLEDILPTVSRTKRPLFLIDTTTEALSYPDLKTVVALTSPFLTVGLIDCMKYHRVCNKYPLPETTPLKGYSVSYTSHFAELSLEQQEEYTYGLTARNGGTKPEQLINTILTETTSMENIEKIDATPLHKLTIKAKHSRIHPFAVYMGPTEPTVRLLALKRNLGRTQLYHLDCSNLELYCYRYSADEDYPKLIVFKEGGFEYITTRTNIYDRHTAVQAAAAGKLLSMRSEDLYSILQDGAMNNTLVQYYNSTLYTSLGMIGILERELKDLRESSNVVHEVYETTFYSVDCALYDDICQANKVEESNGLHYINPKRVIKHKTSFMPTSDYLQFIKQSQTKDELVDSDALPNDNTLHGRKVREEFKKFQDEL